MDKNEALRTFTTGENFHLQHYLGAHQEEVDGKVGYSFRVWAPNAQSVHLIGDFTNWYENQIPMARNEAGVWEVFTDLPKEGDNCSSSRSLFQIYSQWINFQNFLTTATFDIVLVNISFLW